MIYSETGRKVLWDVLLIVCWYWSDHICCEMYYVCCAVYSGNYPPPPRKYSMDLRSLITELFRQNPRYDLVTFSVSETVMLLSLLTVKLFIVFIINFIISIHCDFLCILYVFSIFCMYDFLKWRMCPKMWMLYVILEIGHQQIQYSRNRYCRQRSASSSLTWYLHFIGIRFNFICELKCDF